MFYMCEDDEDTPLLQRPQQPTTTPLPWDQLWIILFSQLSDPLSSKTLVPFIPQVIIFPLLGLESDRNRNFTKSIRDIGVTRRDESQVGHYVGILLMRRLFFIGIDSISVSMVSFGLSKTFLGLVLSRAVCGVFNGSNSVIESMVMDITDVTYHNHHQKHAPPIQLRTILLLPADPHATAALQEPEGLADIDVGDGSGERESHKHLESPEIKLSRNSHWT
ncbi:hypothetical protein BDR03DRAFT_1090874 [Suillus americanus]|nr:hypothetical protein BDR03DRAFT_1090874 [Suillus americanus]